MRPFFLLLLAVFVHETAFSQATKQRKILFIGAHPDDETAISTVLSKYARLGNKVYVMIATDGKDGTRVTKIPAGDSLGALRKEETRCGCARLGVEPPIFLSIERLDTKIGVRNYFRAHQQFRDSLRQYIPLIAPDLIITFGPDGDTHHSEHIVVGGAVTEVLLAEAWVERYPLYYMAWKKDKTDIDALGYVDDQFMNVEVDHSSVDKGKAIEAIKCFVTQYTEKEIEEEIEKLKKDKENKTYFRRFVVMKGLKKDFD